MIPYFPKMIASKGLLLYVISLLTVSMAFMKYSMGLLWIVLGWWEIALMHLIFGCIFCITIVGIPWGLQHFKMIGASLLPFGKDIV